MRPTATARRVWLLIASTLLVTTSTRRLEAQPPAPPAVAADTTGPVFDEAEVDDPARPLEIPRPVYPEALRARGVCGVVQLAYIVGTNGRAEPASVTVRAATRKSLGEAAAGAIRLAIFKPAKREGKVVRQRVLQRVRFDIGVVGSVSCR